MKFIFILVIILNIILFVSSLKKKALIKNKVRQEEGKEVGEEEKKPTEE